MRKGSRGNSRSRASQTRRRIEVETVCPDLRCGWREHVSASLVTLSNCPLCGTSMQLAPVCDCCGESPPFTVVDVAMYDVDRPGVAGCVGLGSERMALCAICYFDAVASFGQLCGRLTEARFVRDGILPMGKWIVEFAFAIEEKVTIPANGFEGTVVGLWEDRDRNQWIYIEYVLSTGAVVTDWFRPAALAAIAAAPETRSAPTESTDEPLPAARDGRRDELAPPLEAGHR